MDHAIWLKWCVMSVALTNTITAIAQDTAVDAVDAPPPTPQAASSGAESPIAERSILAEGAAVDANSTDHDFCKCVGEANSPTVAKIEKALTSPLHSQGLTFADTPLKAVMNQIQDEYGFPIEIDTAALDEMGIGSDEPVTIKLSGISLRSALQLALRHRQLTYVVLDEVLMITTPEAAEHHLQVCVYDVREIVGPAKAQSSDQLIDAIVSCVATDTWAENGGGEAEIRWLEPGFLIVSQTQAVHEEIQGLLAAIRAVRKRLPNHGANAADSAAAVDRVSMRYIQLRTGAAADLSAARGQTHDLVTESFSTRALKWQAQQ
jgi:hypothetical protein